MLKARLERLDVGFLRPDGCAATGPFGLSFALSTGRPFLSTAMLLQNPQQVEIVAVLSQAQFHPPIRSRIRGPMSSVHRRYSIKRL